MKAEQQRDSPSAGLSSLFSALLRPRKCCHNAPMCGRLPVVAAEADHRGTLRCSADWQDDWSPRYNIAPTQPVPVIRQHPKEPIRADFADAVGTDSVVGEGHVRRSEDDQRTLGDGTHVACVPRSYETPRCLIPADGFYEWQRRGSAKQPFCFEVGDGGLFAFAGLWEHWRDPSGQWVKSCSILTTTPNAVTSAIHDRMPVILEQESFDLWLDLGMQNAATISELLRPYDSRLMSSYPVSSRINRVANDDAECSRPVELAETQDRLFSL